MDYSSLLQINDIEVYSQDKQLEILGQLFDLSYDNFDEKGLDHAFLLAQRLNIDNLTSKNKIQFYYFIANGWAARRKLNNSSENIWAFKSDELTNEIYNLRKAISIEKFEEISSDRIKCSIYTNLGTSFSTIGRIIEAQEFWLKALEINPNFAMASANIGVGLFSYGKNLFDRGHSGVFLRYSSDYLKTAIDNEPDLTSESRQYFINLYNEIMRYFQKDATNVLPDLNRISLGDGDLKLYRQWSLINRLYINPLNDLGSNSIASHDCLNMPSITIENGESPIYVDLFNQIKQEYSTSRFLLYEAIHKNKTHISDTDVIILDTQQSINYSYRIEQMKMAFRLSYSILDKIAFLLNGYLKLGISNSKVYFKNIWFEEDKKTLRHFFTQSENWPLRGLYWLSKDLYEKDFEGVLEPEAKEIAYIRNHIEHKLFSVISDEKAAMDSYGADKSISYKIAYTDFSAKTLKLLKLVRAATMYLSLSIYQRKEKFPVEQVGHINLNPIGR